jgi:hypothetical protein
MSPTNPQSFLRASVPLWFIFLSACTTTRETFTGQSTHQVWTAMVAVANTPDYWHPTDYTERWIVRENDAWDDAENRRIEVFRKLERELHMPGQTPVQESREWRFTVVMEEDDPPVVTFTSRGAGVPAHAWHEADRFFAQVWDVLGVKDPPKPPKPIKTEPTQEEREAIQLYDN